MTFLQWMTVGCALIVAALLAAVIDWFLKRGSIERLLPKAPPQQNDAPHITVVVAARDEAEKIEAHLKSLLHQDYPNFDIIIVNDRSRDETGSIVQCVATESDRIELLTIQEGALPSGWLGKSHALMRGAQQAKGEYLLFSDADIIFDRGALAAIADQLEGRQLDHLAVIPDFRAAGFWEKVYLSYGIVFFQLILRTWRVWNGRSFAGIGACNVIRRSLYNSFGGHSALRMEIVDDVALGFFAKQHSQNCGVAHGAQILSLHWASGLGATMCLLEKNGFAGAGYRLRSIVVATIALLGFGWLPVVGLALGLLTGQMALLLLSATIFFLVASLYRLGVPWRQNWLSALYPIAATCLLIALLRSTWCTLARGGVLWRKTFYPLHALRAGLTFPR